MIIVQLENRPSFSFPAGAARFRFKMSWYFMELMITCTLTGFQGSLEEKQPDNITEPPPPPYTYRLYLV